jgi:formylglycine-generating enzyme required for sulfatase activity
VTAQDGTTSKNYVVTVTRGAPSSNADLSNLTVSEGSLTPIFASGTTSYSVNVPNSTTSITVTGTTADSNATLGGDNGVAKTLNVGVNTITITVTAQDGTTSKNYVVTVTRVDVNDYISASIGILKYIPVGQFRRDTTMNNISVISTAYRMSQYEITRAQFNAIMGVDPTNTSFSGGHSDPVQMTNWYHAISFCNKLSLAEGLTPVYTVTGINFNTLTYAGIPTTGDAAWDYANANWNANGYRLPKENEWMWAAMGAPADGQYGNTNYTGHTKVFAGSTGSNAIEDYVWYSTNSADQTHPVGTKLANEIGLYDVSGNVWEWCWDRVGGDGSAINPTGTYRIIKGASWYNGASELAISLRSPINPCTQLNNVGFRVVRL